MDFGLRDHRYIDPDPVDDRMHMISDLHAGQERRLFAASDCRINSGPDPVQEFAQLLLPQCELPILGRPDQRAGQGIFPFCERTMTAIYPPGPMRLSLICLESLVRTWATIELTDFMLLAQAS